MKKVFSKIRREKEPEPPARITTETLAEHREKVLAGGRRFKYPVQYARHKLVFNAIIISVAALLLLIATFVWQLYFAQNTSDFMYRVTRVIPVPVAIVDGKWVSYSDYLMKYRSSMHYLEEKERLDPNSEDGKRQSDFVKNQAMDDAIADAYAAKLARELNLSVSNVELEEFLKQQRISPDGEVSEATYDAVILDYYGWSPDEYRQAMRAKLLRQKVAFAVDELAQNTANRIETSIKGGAKNLKQITTNTNKSGNLDVVFGALGFLPKTNQDGGISAAAAQLKKGQISGPIQSTTGDGLYFVKLIDSDDTRVNYEYIQVPLTVFTERLSAAQAADGTVNELIKIPELETTPQTQ